MQSIYNTRRKSVSLTALGVQLPGRSRASTESKSDSSNTDPSARNADSNASPPSKRAKTSHSPSSPPRASPNRQASRPRKNSNSPTPAVAGQADSKSRQMEATATEQSRPKSKHLEYTPPPSPRDLTDGKIDHDAINDDIVEGVVTQLEKTGNRPHLIRELATILATTNSSVTSSANAPALLSSRLASFMKRGCWSTSNPCPVGKELIPVHPRRVFYYLTDRQRQELPDTSDDIYAPLGITSPTAGIAPVTTPNGIMGPPPQLPAKRAFEPALAKLQNTSPPLSIASGTGDDDSTTNSDERRERWAPSPSPEVDLSIHDAVSECGDDVGDKKKEEGSPGRSIHNNGRSHGIAKQELEPPRQLHLNTRAQSPRVEGDEREFRDTVFSLRASPTASKEPPTPVENKMDGVVKEEDSNERDSRRLPDYEMDAYTSAPPHNVSSPAFPAQAGTILTLKQAPAQAPRSSGIEDVLMTDYTFGTGLYRWDLNAPKDIDVDELDSLLEEC